jgi:SPP1 gp7 family putative phage head morphogenesis protein
MRLGIMKGETLQELRNRIDPKIDLRTADQLIQRDFAKTARRNAEALVRTSTLTIMRRAHLDVFEANSDVIGSLQWLATLDGRTTPFCQKMDGLEWTLPDYEPKGHEHKFPGISPHWNCRSVVIPITKTWEELAKEAGGDARLAKELDNITPDERASLGGPVDAGVTYKDWFEVQPKEVQLEILGPKRHEEYQRTGLLPTEMVGAVGGPLSLDAVQEKNFQKQFRDLLEKISKKTLELKIVEHEVPYEARSLNDAEIKYFKNYGSNDPINEIPAYYDKKNKWIIFNQDAHRTIYGLDYTSGKPQSVDEIHENGHIEKIYFTKPEELQLRLHAHELAHIKHPYHGDTHRALMFEYYRKLADVLLKL